MTTMTTTSKESFSGRMGLEAAAQTVGLNKRTRALLYEVYSEAEKTLGFEYTQSFALMFFSSSDNRAVFKDTGQHYIKRAIQDIFTTKEWHKVFSIIEHIYQHKILAKEQESALFVEEHRQVYNSEDNIRDYELHAKYRKAESAAGFAGNINRVLEECGVGYRLVGGLFAPLTNDAELGAITQAITAPYSGAGKHLRKAIKLFSDRDEPDYRGSIKESIRAAESAANEAAGMKKATLGECLPALDAKGVTMHGKMQSALKDLCGFVSASDGMRHTETNEALEADKEMAQFMMITASALVGYISAKANAGKGDDGAA